MPPLPLHPRPHSALTGINSGGLRCALPLLFHNLLTVRRAVARLLAAVLLLEEAGKWEGWGGAVEAHVQAARQSGRAGQVGCG